ncbi:MAG: hypothetical protein ACLVJH_01190 [Faecalibacterium prausnitzii]
MVDTSTESGYGTCQVIDLATGAASARCRRAHTAAPVCGDKLVFSCYARPEDWTITTGIPTTSPEQLGGDAGEATAPELTAPRPASAYRLFYDSDTLSDWVELDVCQPETKPPTRLCTTPRPASSTRLFAGLSGAVLPALPPAMAGTSCGIITTDGPRTDCRL